MIASSVSAQHTEVTVEDNQTISGNKTFTGTTQINDLVSSEMNHALVVDGMIYTTLASALASLSTNQTLFIPINVTLGITTTTSLNNIAIQCLNNATITYSANVQWNFTGNNQTVSGCSFVGPGIGVSTLQPVIPAGNNFTFTHNTVSGFGSTGGNGTVEVIGGGVIEISFNTMYGNAEGPLFVNNTTTGTTISQIRIIGNNIDTSAATAAGTEPIAIHTSSGTANIGEVTVDLNVLRGPKVFCIEVGDFGGAIPYDIALNGNTCKLTQNSTGGGYSIAGSGATHVTVNGNVFNANGYTWTIAGIEFSGVSGTAFDGAANGNVVIGGAPANGASGIGCSVSCQHLSITGNIIDGFGTTGAGIYIGTSTASGQITDNVVESNTITFPASGAGKGIWQQCNASSSVCSRNVYSGNNIYGTGTGGSIGISIENDTGTSARENIGPNTITNIDTGLSLSSGVTYALIATQQISSFISAAISDSSTSEVYPNTVNLTSGGSTGTSAISPTPGNSSNFTFALPSASGTFSLLGITSCGSSASCSGSVQEPGKGWIMNGTVAFSSSTTASITGMAPSWTSATSFNCSVADPTHAYTWLITAQTTSGFTITAGTSNSDTWNWTCVGY